MNWFGRNRRSTRGQVRSEALEERGAASFGVLTSVNFRFKALLLINHESRTHAHQRQLSHVPAR